MQFNKVLGAACTFVMGAALISSVAMGAERERRYYDREHHDYHQWNNQEDRAYRAYLQNQHREYREFRVVRHPQQREYFRWRHTHPDNSLFKVEIR
jgi:hypothetical protein